jgi:hypothetical protein
MLPIAEPVPLPVPLPSLRLVREVRVRRREERLENAVIAIVAGGLVMSISFVVGFILSVVLT